MTFRLLATMVVVAAFVCASGGQAMAAHVACGDVITSDTTLDSDLSCPDSGVLIGANGITLDLGGHTISGSGASGTGVANGSHTGVTVKGGTIQGFDTGVAVGAVTGNLLRDLTVADNFFGIALFDTDSSRIEKNRIDSSSIGVWLYGSTGSADDNVVAENELVGNGTAVDLTLARDNMVTGNSISGHLTGVFMSEAERTQVRHNDFSDPAYEGTQSIFLIYGSTNHIEKNRISGGGFGIYLDSAPSHNTIESNRITAAAYGIYMIVAVSHNRVAKNHISDSSAPGILLYDDGFEGPSVGNSLVENHVLRSAGDGILVQGEGVESTLVERNHASANGEDGIDVEAPGTTITANGANGNFDYGIEASADVIDGGGNRAAHNGNPAQCLNVICK